MREIFFQKLLFFQCFGAFFSDCLVDNLNFVKSFKVKTMIYTYLHIMDIITKLN